MKHEIPKGLAWKGDVPDDPNLLALGSDEEGIVGWRVRPRLLKIIISSLGAGWVRRGLGIGEVGEPFEFRGTSAKSLY
jgi:hypothetical protein